jgi:hypothetical protein
MRNNNNAVVPMSRILLAALGLLALSACQPQFADADQGVGFDRPGDAQVGAPLDATAPVDAGAPSISDEQDFAAVSGRQTIESDAERIAANRAAYQQVQPTALPTRNGGDAATIVEFALSTTNNVGQPIYSRSMIMAQSRFIRNCGKYPSQDMAQQDFLGRGGPRRDPKGLDPDGDGFACYWDPAPFRTAKLGALPPPVAVEVSALE